jgi:uncharacterized OB-fold protein
MSQVVDCDFNDLEIGKRVKLVFRKIQEDGFFRYYCLWVQMCAF